MTNTHARIQRTEWAMSIDNMQRWIILSQLSAECAHNDDVDDESSNRDRIKAIKPFIIHIFPVLFAVFFLLI